MTGSNSGLQQILDETEGTGFRVLLVGIDGATFDLVGPMATAGQLPHFESLLERGTRGALRSRTPMKSPALWTTIVTGALRDVHGIDGFRVDEHLVRSSDRNSLALWEITSEFGLRNGWAGFWATWPAEPVEGWMISDRMARTRFAEWNDAARTAGVAYPAELIPEMRTLVVDPDEPPLTEITGLVSLTPTEQEQMLAFRKPQHGHGLSVLKFAYCAQRSFERMMLRMLDTRPQPDLAGVFLVANDAISHTFWHYFRPADFEGVDPDEADRLGRIIPAMYRHNDRYLGELLDRVDPSTVVIIVSDHGFQSSGRVPTPAPVQPWAARAADASRSGQVAVGQSGMHHLAGMFLAAGGPFRSRAVVEIGIEDVTPTILAVLGLPISRSMAGRVVEEALEPSFLAKHPVTYIDSYDDLVERRKVDVESDAGEARLREQLEALGYIESDDSENETDSSH